MQTRRRLLLLAILGVAGLLAFPLRDLIHGTVVVPAAFVAWNVGLFYRYFSQAIWWGVILAVVFLMLVFSLIPRSIFQRAANVKQQPHIGPVEELALSIGKAQRGTYFKWLIANRLGRLAHQILLQRESGLPRPVFAPLVGPDWQPPADVQRYLETGLQRSFADFPNVRRFLGAPEKTPLELDLKAAVEFLESQVQNHGSGYGPDLPGVHRG